MAPVLAGLLHLIALLRGRSGWPSVAHHAPRFAAIAG
jgi:hypothetical protein